MKLMAAAAIAGGLVAAPMIGAGTASAIPNVCDGAGCVPYVSTEAQLGEFCKQNTRYNYGFDGSGNTLACNSKSTWISSPPLVGVRTLRSACDSTGVAQSPDGVPLVCKDGAWSADYWTMFYG
ncbi:hypothetical protein [Mycolicibacterium parafortuitum]|uniref:Secreted protein n=1 Tax=Mycolicibacterium parafortuitum TaxID=39692 RepID=A0A375YCG2_MYCPF|nr:hypothetical protein [Mycolicibacterium parafortuitum]ORB30784.1 hypothetical protein BST38_08570 [Mycolicibacterium parafortuitum]SRX78790.1 hypothetical protein MPP7335_00519 [Mycolicibacterium parafortuitum]